MSERRQQRSLHDGTDGAIHSFKNLGFMIGIQRHGGVKTFIITITVAEEEKERKDHDQKISHKKKGIFGEIGALCQ